MTGLRRRGQRGLGCATLYLLERAADVAVTRGPITVRGVAYQLFVVGEIPSMAKKDVDRVGRILVYAREHGIVAWEKIVDETREAERPATFDNLVDFSKTVARAYRRDLWASQAYNVQVWSEKATVGGIIRPVTEAYGVPFLAMHGFGSATVVHDTAIASRKDRRQLVILYIGDWDPSGMYMAEVDLPKRVAQYGGCAIIRRIALTGEDLPGLPSFKAKPADPRFKWFRSRYGEDAWELDALDPRILRARIETAIREYINPVLWERAAWWRQPSCGRSRNSLRLWQERESDLFAPSSK